jgi:hypothetical protein
MLNHIMVCVPASDNGLMVYLCNNTVTKESQASRVV